MGMQCGHVKSVMGKVWGPTFVVSKSIMGRV